MIVPSETLQKVFPYCVISLVNFRLLFNLSLIRSFTARGSGTSVLSRWSLQKLRLKQKQCTWPQKNNSCSIVTMTMITNRTEIPHKCYSSNRVRGHGWRFCCGTLAAVNYIAEVNFSLVYILFLVLCLLYLNSALLSAALNQHNVDTCHSLSWSKKPSLASLHDCRPISRKLRAVHLLFVHHLVPGITDKLKDRKWALNKPTKYIAYARRFPVL